ncbi:M6 family metalloprotease domain-containing protein [Fibrobacterota bacterium]
MMNNKVSSKTVSICLVAVWLAANPAFSRPHNGEAFRLRQPDNTSVDVLVWGDEFYQDVESPDGYTLIRDKRTGWICYAGVNGQGTEYVSTGVVYRSAESGEARNLKSRLRKHLRITAESIRRKSAARRLELNVEDRGTQLRRRRALTKSGQAVAEADTVYGLTLLVDFQDVKSAFSHLELTSLFNKKGYGTFGSVLDYFEAVSNNKYTYINRVSDFITLGHDKSYYDTPNGYGPIEELIDDAMDILVDRGFDFTSVSTDSRDRIIALNILYAGSPDEGWGNGLWPHSGSYRGSFSHVGITARRYQMTDIGTSPDISTIIHESGHLLFSWPDLYAYEGNSNTIGRYGVMCANTSNPQFPNPYFRHNEGWIDITDISNALPGEVFHILSNSHSAFLYSGANNGSSAEMYYIEAREQKGRHASLPDEGLLIWHIDEDGINTRPEGDLLVAVEQADGNYDMENGERGGEGDLFHAGDNDRFNDNTSPSAQWHNGNNSGIDIANISEVGERMVFTMGVDVSPYVMVFEPGGLEEWEHKKTYKIKWHSNLSENISIELLQNGLPYSIIESSIENSHTYNWQIPEDAPVGSGYSIRISSAENSTVMGESENTFFIMPEYRIFNYPYIQNFDNFAIGNDLSGHWEQSTDDDIDWTVLSGATPSKSHPNGGGTGPDGDHTSPTGTGGKYIYTEASTPNNPEKTLDLLSPVFDLTLVEEPELLFWAHMYSADGNIGELWVDINVDGAWSDGVMHLTGDHGDEWFQQTLDLQPYIGERVQIRFRSITGTEYDGDICIDDFEIDGIPKVVGASGKTTPASSRVLRTGSYLILQNITGMVYILGLNGEQMAKANGNVSSRIGISHLPNGVYLVKTSAHTFKFIK